MILFCSFGYGSLKGDWDKIKSTWQFVVANIGHLSTWQVTPGGGLDGSQFELVGKGSLIYILIHCHRNLKRSEDIGLW